MVWYVAVKDIINFYRTEKHVFIWLIISMIVCSFVINYSYAFARYRGNLYDENMTYEMLLDSISINDKNPIKIDIYPKDYKSKEKIESIIKKYNEENSNDKVYYTDYLKVFLNSITSLIKMITYVLTAFIGVSLIVSSIMISIITYISVL